MHGSSLMNRDNSHLKCLLRLLALTIETVYVPHPLYAVCTLE